MRNSEEEVQISSRILQEQLLLAYLELFPYLHLDVRFSASELLQEAIALKNEFNSHRDVHGWCALGLRTLFGDPQLTESEAKYDLSQHFATDYAFTDFAHKCPLTMAAIAQIVHIDKCKRIRFMRLAPGAMIPCHRDEFGPVALVTHLPLSYEAECHFYVGLQANGSRNKNTIDIPFENGVATAVNVASYHAVRNESSSERYSIIVEGPLKYTNRSLLKMARNSHPGYSDLEIISRALKI